MEIKSTLKNRAGQTLDLEYCDIDTEEELVGRKVKCVHAYCFYNGKMVIVYADGKGYWAPPGGAVEEGESVADATAREVLEETNMKVIKQEIIGYQDVFEPGGVSTQTRSVCLVEPMGDFVSDPDGDVTEIKLIDPKDYKKFFDWGEVGGRLMERALEIKAHLESVPIVKI